MSKRWHKWTKAEHALLVRKYRTCGDTAIAEMLNEKFPKDYPWTLKHVEKRRKYFGLSRGRKAGECFTNRSNLKATWDTRGRARDGEVRLWKVSRRRKPHIKINGRFVDYARWVTQAKEGDVVRTFEGAIRKIDRKENQLLNAKMRASMPSELKQTIRAINTLKKLINGKGNQGSARNAV